MQDHSTAGLFDQRDVRRCRRCHIDKPLSDFATYDNGSGPKIRRTCRVCAKTPFNSAALTEKLCRDCGCTKPITDFPQQRTPIGNMTRGSICRPCRAARCRAWNRKHRHGKVLNQNLVKSFGITLETYNLMLASQSGLCAICGQPPERTDHRNQRLQVDHCHDCGSVRKLLCSTCNNGLGCFKDNQALLAKAIEYLAGHEHLT